MSRCQHDEYEELHQEYFSKPEEYLSTKPEEYLSTKPEECLSTLYNISTTSKLKKHKIKAEKRKFQFCSNQLLSKNVSMGCSGAFMERKHCNSSIIRSAPSYYRVECTCSSDTDEHLSRYAWTFPISHKSADDVVHSLK